MRDDKALLLDMIGAAEDAIRFVSDLDETESLASRLHQYAVIRAIEVIGEAASRVSADFRDRHPEVPWRDITGMRHRLVHGYADVRLDVVWVVARDRLPGSLVLLSPLLPPE